jgi:hypothetical protein
MTTPGVFLQLRAFLAVIGERGRQEIPRRGKFGCNSAVRPFNSLIGCQIPLFDSVGESRGLK